jgi:UDP-glucose 4-epimerase
VNHAVLGEVKRFVFTSSIAVYGAAQLPMHEDMTPQPEDPYGISKYAVELDLAAANSMFGLDHTIFRPHNVYGERQNIADTYRNVIGIFMNNVMQGKPLTIFGDGAQTRAFSHISDVAPVIARAPLVPASRNEVFNVGADQPYTVRELADTVAAAFGVPADVTHLPRRNEVLHAYSDHSKVAKIFGKRDHMSLERGIALMAAWAREIGPRPAITFTEPIEVAVKLPPSWQPSTEGN